MFYNSESETLLNFGCLHFIILMHVLFRIWGIKRPLVRYSFLFLQKTRKISFPCGTYKFSYFNSKLFLNIVSIQLLTRKTKREKNFSYLSRKVKCPRLKHRACRSRLTDMLTNSSTVAISCSHLYIATSSGCWWNPFIKKLKITY